MFENIDRRKIVIASLIMALIIVIALILWWIFAPKAQAPATVAPPTQPTVIDQASSQPAPLPPATTDRLKEDASYPLGLKQLAMAFAERFGSYSTDEPVKNLADLAPFMTANFIKISASPADIENSGIFSGFSTKALSSNLAKLDATSATVIVKTQRTQTLGAGEASKTFIADLEILAVKSGNEWKIDRARWQ